jgi:hypothetical protein
MSTREYRVWHHHTQDRIVAVTDIVATSRKEAIRDAKEDAKRWNLTETRENMVTKFLVCEGLKVDL